MSDLLHVQVVSLINEAQLVGKEKKMEYLHQVRYAITAVSCMALSHNVSFACSCTLDPQVKELIIKKDPNLLDSFLDVSFIFPDCACVLAGLCVN